MTVIAAAHPADTFGEKAEALLRETAQTDVVCINPTGGTFEEMVDEIDAVRRARGIDRWVFWGISGGGWLGEIYAHRHPEALSGVILESVCRCFRERLADPRCILSPFHPQWRAALEGRGLIEPDSHARVGDPLATEWIDVDNVGAVFRRIDGPALLVSPMPVTDALRRAMPAMWTMDARPWLHEIATPALVIAGSADPVAPLPHVRAVHEAIAGSELFVAEGGGHSPVMARRADLMEAVRRFVGGA